MKKSFWSTCVVVVLMSGHLSWHTAFGGAGQASAKLTVCPGLNYGGDRCECKPAEKCELCPCGACTGGDKCACIEAVRKSSGSITGQISVFRTKVKTSGPKSDKDIVVYLEKVGDNNFSPLLKKEKMDQKGLIFIPHVLVVQKGTEVEFLNSDNDKHNVYFVNDKSGKTKDLGTWQPGESRNHTFEQHHELVKKPGKNGAPDTMIVLCKLHLEMAAYVVILGNPFFATALIDGDTQKAVYTIKNVPPGTYKLNIWHKKLKLRGGAREVVVEAGKSAKADIEVTKTAYVNK
ncbi:MAG: cupredoxin domain-containing protein [Planctomycetota bacterium]